MNKTLTASIRNRHGLNIAVLVEIPDNPQGLIFVVHGWLSSMTGSSSLAVSGAAKNAAYTTVRFDCTHANGQSDGAIELSTISTCLADLEDVMAWARQQNWFRMPYTLAGTSLGGITVLEYSKRHSHEVGAVAPICTVISGVMSIEAGNRIDQDKIRSWRDTGFQERDYGDGKSALFPWSHMEDRLKYDALAYAPEMNIPLFMCVGSEDTSCPPDQQQQLFAAWGSQEKELHIIPGCPHRFHEPEHVAALGGFLSAWLETQAK